MQTLSTIQIQEWVKKDKPHDWLPRRLGIAPELLSDWHEKNPISLWLPEDWTGSPQSLISLIGSHYAGRRTITPEVAAWMILRPQVFNEETLRALSCKWASESIPKFSEKGRMEYLIAIDTARLYAASEVSRMDLGRLQRTAAGNSPIGYLSDKSKGYFSTMLRSVDLDPFGLAIALLDGNDAHAAAEAAAANGWRNFAKELSSAYRSPTKDPLRRFKLAGRWAQSLLGVALKTFAKR